MYASTRPHLTGWLWRYICSADRCGCAVVQDLSELCRTLYTHLGQAVSDRDAIALRLDEMDQEKQFFQAQAQELIEESQQQTPARTLVTPEGERPSSSKHFETIRDLKAQLRAMSEELCVGSSAAARAPPCVSLDSPCGAET